MNGLIVFEDYAWRQFLPLTYWRAVCQLRCGRYTLVERCRRILDQDITGWWVREDLAEVSAARGAPAVNEPAFEDVLLANGRWIPLGPDDLPPAPCVGRIDGDVAFVRCDAALAARLQPATLLDRNHTEDLLKDIPSRSARGILLHYPWDALAHNRDMLMWDWQELDHRLTGAVHPSACLVNESRIHIGQDSAVRAGAVLDAERGPLYLGERVIVEPQAVIQGPAFVGDDTVINAGAWIRGDVSIAAGCKVGGEVSASIFLSRSNKQHHGFVGDSYIGAWVNLGAGTTTSNLKNTYGEISVPVCGRMVETHRRFVGATIGDFAKTGINQSLTTGSVIGFGTSLAGIAVNEPFTPSFQFISAGRREAYDPARCLEVARRAMARRNRELLPEERAWFLRLPDFARDCETV